MTGTPTGKLTPAYHANLVSELIDFNEFGSRTAIRETEIERPSGLSISVPTYVNEYWTSRQRQGHSLHEISYRACFKPQLPQFFIERLTRPGDTVYDPFMGRGTTPFETALRGRVPIGCDVNPLSALITEPRLTPPTYDRVAQRLDSLDLSSAQNVDNELSVFYHPDTLTEVHALKEYLAARKADGNLDSIDSWIGMVAVSRLTGHSPGFFSVYTMPPNQAVSVDAQRKINKTRNQTPPRRVVSDLIKIKTRSLLANCDEITRKTLGEMAGKSLLLAQKSDDTPQIVSDSVALVITSPPFLDVVDYAKDNWLR